MNKKILSISPILFGSISLFFVLSTVSCNNNSNANQLKASDFTKPIIKKSSIEKIINRLEFGSNLFSNNISEEEFEREMKKILKEELVVDKDSLIYKELEKLNKIDEFNQQYIDESYNGLIEEIKNENVIYRHWIGIFKSHSWQTVARRLQALSLNLLAIADLTLQLAPAIVSFIKFGDTQSLVDALSSFDGKFTSITKWLFIKGIEDLRNWKINSKCKSKFYIWGQTL